MSALCLASVALAGATTTEAWQTVDSAVKYSVDGSCSCNLANNGMTVNGAGRFLAESLVPNLSIKTAMSEVVPKRGAVVYVRTAKGCEHIFVLLGESSFLVDNHRANLKAGDEVVVTDHEPSYKDLVGGDEVGRRQIHIFKVAVNRVCTSAEFSLIHLAEREPLVYRVVHSNDPADKGIRERLIKTAAVLSIVTGAHGQYTTGAQ